MLPCLVCFIIVKIYFIFSYSQSFMCIKFFLKRFMHMSAGASSGQKRAPEVRELELYGVLQPDVSAET